ncbi:YolD-like family protein [Oceanobacillus bengalensis]|uniref:YolD-like family protein n=1 Tax=Oceanobacillus bengalensis TaxID=1435466 RepID=A0A494YSN3_9BACI|nr:YolD-like family protein [Oceanobacillus bengalensis]RKQ13139.1 YolD-like family protein [Oceanobacillus bengalensis]
MDLVNDRGTKKWTAMMMPEHIHLLNQMWKEKEYKEKPNLDMQQLNEMNSKLQLAIHNNLTVEIKYYEAYDFHMIQGKLEKIDIVNKYIVLENSERKKILFDQIIDVMID